MHSNLENLCIKALEAVQENVPQVQAAEVRDYIERHGEYGVGIEFLIDWLTEEETMISPAQFQAIYEAMAAMGLSDDDRVSYLREHNVTRA
jgi:hypothetical protein